jgi:hypothetical protein
MWAVLSFVATVVAWIGWIGFGAVPVAIAAAVVWFFPPVRKPAIAAGVLWIVAFTFYTLGDSHGAYRVQVKWDAALQAAGERGASARAQAEQEVPVVEPELEPEPEPQQPAAPSAACAPAAAAARDDRLFRSDPDNRDRRRR